MLGSTDALILGTGTLRDKGGNLREGKTLGPAELERMTAHTLVMVAAQQNRAVMVVPYLVAADQELVVA